MALWFCYQLEELEKVFDNVYRYPICCADSIYSLNLYITQFTIHIVAVYNSILQHTGLVSESLLHKFECVCQSILYKCEYLPERAK